MTVRFTPCTAANIVWNVPRLNHTIHVKLKDIFAAIINVRVAAKPILKNLPKADSPNANVVEQDTTKKTYTKTKLGVFNISVAGVHVAVIQVAVMMFLMFIILILKIRVNRSGAIYIGLGKSN